MPIYDESRSVELGDPYRFKDGTVTLTEDQIGLWIAMPTGYFLVAKASNSTGQVHCLAGEYFAPTT